MALDYTSDASREAFSAQLDKLLTEQARERTKTCWFDLPQDIREIILWDLIQQHCPENSMHHNSLRMKCNLVHLHMLISKLSQVQRLLTTGDLYGPLRKLGLHIRKVRVSLSIDAASYLEEEMSFDMTNTQAHLKKVTQGQICEADLNLRLWDYLDSKRSEIEKDFIARRAELTAWSEAIKDLRWKVLMSTMDKTTTVSNHLHFVISFQRQQHQHKPYVYRHLLGARRG